MKTKKISPPKYRIASNVFIESKHRTVAFLPTGTYTVSHRYYDEGEWIYHIQKPGCETIKGIAERHLKLA